MLDNILRVFVRIFQQWMTVGLALSGKEEIEQALDPATHNAETDPPVTHGNLRLAIMPMSLKEIAM